MVVSAFDDCINIAWDAPSNRGGSRILGYILEKRKKGSNLWSSINAVEDLIKGLGVISTTSSDSGCLTTTLTFHIVLSLTEPPEKKYAVKDVVAGMEYEFRVTAVNLSGPGECSSPSEFVFARDPKSKCCFWYFYNFHFSIRHF